MHAGISSTFFPMTLTKLVYDLTYINIVLATCVCIISLRMSLTTSTQIKYRQLNLYKYCPCYVCVYYKFKNVTNHFDTDQIQAAKPI